MSDMLCRSGRHEWIDPLDARRCCSDTWRRSLRIRGDEGDLDPIGRQRVPCGAYMLIYGWVRVGPACRRNNES